MEDNKLIAESIFCPDFVKTHIEHYSDSGNDIALKNYMDNLCFHLEWDWLMPVVKNLKSNRTNPEHTFISVAFGKLNLALMEAEITPVYKEVVNIIKLYNQNK